MALDFLRPDRPEQKRSVQRILSQHEHRETDCLLIIAAEREFVSDFPPLLLHLDGPDALRGDAFPRFGVLNDIESDLSELRSLQEEGDAQTVPLLQTGRPRKIELRMIGDVIRFCKNFDGESSLSVGRLLRGGSETQTVSGKQHLFSRQSPLPLLFVNDFRPCGAGAQHKQGQQQFFQHGSSSSSLIFLFHSHQRLCRRVFMVSEAWNGSLV